MNVQWGRVRAIVRKELQDYRRNRFVMGSMAVLPVIFVALPMIQIFTASKSGTRIDLHIGISLLYLLAVPTILPSTLAAHSVVGEREQGTLEPVLTTPIHRQEFLIGKALAAFIPTVLVAYTIFGIFLACVAIFADPAVSSVVFEGSHLLVQLLFTPLLAGWSIWIGIAVSTRMSDVRAAQQLGVLASLPPLVVVALMSLDVIPPSTGLALGLAATLLVFDGLAWRAVATMFDRERLITGRR